MSPTPGAEYLGAFSFRCTECGAVHFMEREAIACYESHDSGTWDICPKHGRQRVLRSYATRGADPYNVNVLHCLDHVACFGPHEPNVIVRRKRTP